MTSNSIYSLRGRWSPGELALQLIRWLLCKSYASKFFHFHFRKYCLGCPRTLAIVNNAAGNTKIQTSLWDSVFMSFGWIPRVELLDGMVALVVTFGGPSTLLSTAAVPVYIPTHNAQGHILTYTCRLLSFWRQPFRQVWGGVSVWFWPHFPDD